MPSQGIWGDSSLLDPFTNYSQGIKDTRPYYINRTDFNQDYIYITIDVMALVFWFQQIYIRSLNEVLNIHFGHEVIVRGWNKNCRLGQIRHWRACAQLSQQIFSLTLTSNVFLYLQPKWMFITYIYLELKAQGHGMTFKVCSLGSKYITLSI